jgi:hypothetical protein
MSALPKRPEHSFEPLDEDFAVSGSIVRLRSGSPLMVIDYTEEGPSGEVYCYTVMWDRTTCSGIVNKFEVDTLDLLRDYDFENRVLPHRLVEYYNQLYAPVTVQSQPKLSWWKQLLNHFIK